MSLSFFLKTNQLINLVWPNLKAMVHCHIKFELFLLNGLGIIATGNLKIICRALMDEKTSPWWRNVIPKMANLDAL